MSYKTATWIAYGLTLVFIILGVVQARDDQWVGACSLWGFGGWSFLMARRLGEGGT